MKEFKQFDVVAAASSVGVGRSVGADTAGGTLLFPARRRSLSGLRRVGATTATRAAAKISPSLVSNLLVNHNLALWSSGHRIEVTFVLLCGLAEFVGNPAEGLQRRRDGWRSTTAASFSREFQPSSVPRSAPSRLDVAR